MAKSLATIEVSLSAEDRELLESVARAVDVLKALPLGKERRVKTTLQDFSDDVCDSLNEHVEGIDSLAKRVAELERKADVIHNRLTNRLRQIGEQFDRMTERLEALEKGQLLSGVATGDHEKRIAELEQKVITRESALKLISRMDALESKLRDGE